MRAGVPRGSREKTRLVQGGSGVPTHVDARGTAASTHAHTSSRWSAGRFAHRSSPRTARRAGTCVDANASCERGGSMGGGRVRDRGQEDARREIRWTRRRAHLRGLDEVRLHELGHPVRAERRALIAVRPRPRGRGGVRLPARYRVHARGGLTRSDPTVRRGRACSRPVGLRWRAQIDEMFRPPRRSRLAETPRGFALATRPRAVGVRAPRFARVAMPRRHVASRWSSRCSRRPSRARSPTRASSSTRPPPRRPGRAEFVSCPA